MWDPIKGKHYIVRNLTPSEIDPMYYDREIHIINEAHDREIENIVGEDEADDERLENICNNEHCAHRDALLKKISTSNWSRIYYNDELELEQFKERNPPKKDDPIDDEDGEIDPQDCTNNYFDAPPLNKTFLERREARIKREHEIQTGM
jgi:hypothetical protein